MKINNKRDVFNEKISPRRRVEAVLNKEFLGKVPFTAYGTFWGGPCIEAPAMPFGKYLPQSTVERRLRNQGLCIVDLTWWGYTLVRPNVKVTSTVYDENERFMVRTNYSTPLGNLQTIKEVTDYTYWTHEKMFKSKDDYKIIKYLIDDTIVLPDKNNGEKLIKYLGEDVILRGDFGFEPLQELISGDYFTTEQFCLEWMDNRDEILKLYDSVVKIRQGTYKVVADSPLLFVCYGGNVTPAVISPENFKKYYVPHYEEAYEALHPKGKKLACHFDANMRLFKDIIADTPLDIIEAFTPFPDTDMTAKEARIAWPDKVIWVNFPSSQHLESKEKIAKITREIIDEAGPEGLIIGITEDVPEDRWQENYITIMDEIDRKL